MAQNMNVVTLSGRVIEDAKSVGTGAKFRFVNNRSFKKGDEWHEKSLFLNCVVWGDRAASVLEKAKKGADVIVSGVLEPDNYEKDDGTKVERVQLNVDKVEYLGRFQRSEAKDSAKPQPAAKKAKQTVPADDDEETPF